MTECPDKPESSPGRFRLVLRALAPEKWLAPHTKRQYKSRKADLNFSSKYSMLGCQRRRPLDRTIVDRRIRCAVIAVTICQSSAVAVTNHTLRD